MLMLALKLFRFDIQCGQIHAVDEVLRWDFEHAHRVGTTVPMKVDGAAAAGVEPFIERL
jgi:hypothetical protein